MMSDRRVLAGWFSEDLVRHGAGMVRLLASIGIDGRAMTAVKRAKAYQEWAMNEEAKEVAAGIATRFGETSKRPRAQLRRMAVLMGAEWMRTVANTAAELHSLQREPGTGPLFLPSGNKRTLGGLFFAVARSAAKDIVAARRDFFRCFYDRPKQAKAKPVAKPKRAPPKPKPAPRKQTVAAEVYVVRTSRRAS
jgi:hypothetical protein